MTETELLTGDIHEPYKEALKPTKVVGLDDIYWCSSRTKEWADKAKAKYLELSDKYNTPNQTKKEYQ